MRKKCDLIKHIFFVLLTAMLLLTMLPKRAVAIDGTGYLSAQATPIEDTNLVEIKYSDSAYYTYTNNMNDWAVGEDHDATVGATYRMRVKKAFKIDGVWKDIRITVVPSQIGSYFKIGKRTRNGKTCLRLYAKGSVAKITYELLNNDNSAQTSTMKDLAFGFIDPDGANIIFDGVNSVTKLKQITAYYVPKRVMTGYTDIEFGKGFKIVSNSGGSGYYGINIVDDNLNYADGIIALDKDTNTFTVTWDTKTVGVNDQLLVPILYYRAAKIKYHMNGGSLAATHGEAFSTSGSYVTRDGNVILHTLAINQSLSSYGLVNYNNSSALNVVKKGYVAKAGAEYNTKANGSGQSYNQDVVYKMEDFAPHTNDDGVVILYVNWTPIQYTIGYTLNDGTLGTYQPTSGTYDSNVRISNPTRAGYTFDGWTMTNGDTSTAKYGTSTSTVTTAWNPASTKVKAQYFKNLKSTTGTVTLVANWTPITYTIGYTLNGGSVSSANPTSYTIETPTFTLNNPTKTGYTFKGWTGSNGSTAQTSVSIAKGSTGNKTYTANWQANSYTIGYTLNGGTYGTSHPTSGTFDANVQISNPTRSGYRFDGWTMTNGNTSTAKYGTSASTVTTAWNPASTKVKAQYFKNLRSTSGTVTLVANWTQTSFPQLTIDPNGGSVSVTSPTGGTTETITTSTTYDQNNNTTLTLNNMRKEPTYPKQTFTISYDGNSGIVETTTEANTKSTRTDTTEYEFSSWTKSDPFYGTLATNNKLYTYPSTNVTDTITANYTSTTTQGTPTLVTLPNATRMGYTLNGWYTSASGGTKRGNAGDTYRPSASETLYAHWTINQYDITYNLDGGTNDANNPATYTVETVDININAPTKEGYVFEGYQKTVSDLGWQKGFLNYNTGVIENHDTYPNSFYSGYIALKEGVTYTLSGYDPYPTANIRWRFYDSEGVYLGIPDGTSSGATYTAVEDCYARILFYETSTQSERSSVVLTGSGEYENDVIIPRGSTGDIVLNANWRIANSTLIIDPAGGRTGVMDNSGIIIQDYSEQISISTSYDGSYENQLKMSNPVKDNVIENTTYTVTYEFNGNGTESYDDTATKTETTTFTFDDWELLPNPLYGTLTSGTYNNSPIYTYTYGPTDDVTDTITAVYSENVIDNGTTSIILPTPTWSGHTFEGWWTDETEGNLIGLGGSTYTPTDDITLYAHWAENTATITIKMNNEDLSDSGIHVELYQGNTLKYAYDNAIISGATVSWSGIETGTYDIRASIEWGDTMNIVDTGEDIVVNGESSEDVNYYTVTLYRGTGISEVMTMDAYLYGTSVTINATVKPGYTWQHWTDCSCGENNCFCDPCNCEIITTDQEYEFTMPAEALVRTAEATLNTYTISYDLDGGTVTGTNPTSYTVEDNDITLINPTKSGYAFVGWTGTGLSGSTMTVTIPHGSTGDRSYVAHWVSITTTITIRKDNDNWTTDNNIQVALYQNNSSIYDLNTGTKTGATISWEGIADGTYDIYASKNTSSLNSLEDTGIDIVITNSGTATIDYYTLTLQNGIGISAVSGGGTFLKGQTASIDATVSEGYTWEGWSVISGDTPD